jgi:DNA invertase Pin-like site-specific DNA recombinase
MTEKQKPANRVVMYARVSTSNHRQDPEVQLREMRGYLKLRGFRIVGEYVDAGVSGAKKNRPELDRLMADAAKHRFDAVCVWRLDRFGRSLRHLVNALAQLEEHHVSFISQRDNLDLTTSAGRLMFNVIGAMAEFERDIISERVKAGLHNTQAKGTQLGHPSAVKIDARFTARVRKLYAEVLSYRKVAKKVGVSHQTVATICRQS